MIENDKLKSFAIRFTNVLFQQPSLERRADVQTQAEAGRYYSEASSTEVKRLLVMGDTTLKSEFYFSLASYAFEKHIYGGRSYQPSSGPAAKNGPTTGRHAPSFF